MKRKLTILTCFIALCSFAFGQSGNYWTTNPNTYDGSMTLVAVINIDGEEQRTTQLEIGAFCSDEDNNEELRGNTRLVYKEKKDRYCYSYRFSVCWCGRKIKCFNSVNKCRYFSGLGCYEFKKNNMQKKFKL